MANQIIPMDVSQKFYEKMFGLDSYFNDMLRLESDQGGRRGQSEKTGIISAIKHVGSEAKAVAVETKTFVGQIGSGVGAIFKNSGNGGSCDILLGYPLPVNHCSVHGISLSLSCICGAIILFGIWGGEHV